ncbi:MAG TPA: vitamin K epoxide reductase family protein [Acidimicrobiales bacterium]|nr:vitamin K epoxide reductase family protein [Acidimicrobiales bacterium]
MATRTQARKPRAKAATAMPAMEMGGNPTAGSPQAPNATAPRARSYRDMEPPPTSSQYSAAPIPPRWAPWASMVICALAIADSAWLTYAHYTTPAVLVCSTKGFVDCAAVTTSSYSHPFGIPVAVAGLVWSVGMLALCTPWAWRAWSPWWRRARVAGSVLGVLTVFYLLWAELIKLHHLCEYCTAVHILTIALFFVVVFGTALAVPAGDEEAAFDESV